jgi:hypothetical protein
MSALIRDHFPTIVIVELQADLSPDLFQVHHPDLMVTEVDRGTFNGNQK